MITLQELNILMPTYFLSEELTKINWSSTSDSDKQVLLTEALSEINNLQFDGYKVVESQQDAFPRNICREVIQTPNEVKKALCVLVYEFKRDKTSARKELQRDGVKSISTGGVTETYGDNVCNTEINKKIKKMLSPWLYRGF